MRIELPEAPRISRQDRQAGATRPPLSRKRFPDRRDHAAREQLLRRVRAEFLEMPGLVLTLPQAERLFGMRQDICIRILATLIGEGLLRHTPGNCYTRSAGL